MGESQFFHWRVHWGENIGVKWGRDEGGYFNEFLMVNFGKEKLLFHS